LFNEAVDLGSGVGLDNSRRILVQKQLDARCPDAASRAIGGGDWVAMGKESYETVAAVEEQIERLRRIRRRWADGEGLSEEERPRRDLTLNLLDGAIQDLIQRRDESRRSAE
jgi:hypothetical protein